MNPTLLLFDSGLGGLTIYEAIRQHLPQARYLYCFDNAFFPYSELSEEVIVERALFICQTLLQHYPIDLIVVACNTASTVVLPTLRQQFSIPIVGTVPAIKPAATLSKTKHIGLLATKGTIKRHYVEELIQHYASDCTVECIGSTQLVKIAEQKLCGNAVDIQTLQQELLAWKNQPQLDTVVLGCTHFPLLKTEISQCLPQVKNFIDSGEAIAKRVEGLLVSSRQESFGLANQLFCTHAQIKPDLLQKIARTWGFERGSVLCEMAREKGNSKLDVKSKF